MKRFGFKYSTFVWVLLVLVALIFATSVVLNVYDVVILSDDTVKVVISIAMATISLALLVLTVAAMIRSEYSIKDNYLYYRFGLVAVKTDINIIFQLGEFKKDHKLVMYYKNQKYSVAMINEKYYNDFYEALKKVNPEIIYTVQSAEE